MTDGRDRRTGWRDGWTDVTDIQTEVTDGCDGRDGRKERRDGRDKNDRRTAQLQIEIHPQAKS